MERLSVTAKNRRSLWVVCALTTDQDANGGQAELDSILTGTLTVSL